MTRRVSTHRVVGGQLFLLFWLFAGTVSALPFFDGTYPQALLKAKQENKKLLLYFTANWCGPCRYMEETVFPHDSVSRAVESGFVALKLNYDAWSSKPLIEKYQVGGLPAFIILDAQEVVERQVVGSRSVPQLLAFLTNQLGPDQRDAARTALIRTRYVGREAEANRWKAELGVQAGINRMFVAKRAPDPKIGYEVGLVLVCTKRRLSIRPGLSLAVRGGKLADGQPLRLQYVEVPVHFSYLLRNAALFHLPGGYRINLAPYVATLLKDRHLTKTADYGAKVGISAFVGVTSRLETQLGYNLGLNNIALQTGPGQYNRGFYLSTLFTL